LSSPILGSQSAAAPAGDRDVAAISNYEQRRVLTGYAMDDSSIRTAVAVWTRDDAGPGEVIPTYGHISTWDTSGVTDMSNLFCADEDEPDVCNEAAASFDEDIGAWDTSGVTTMYRMFAESAFNQDIGGWAVHSVTDMEVMFAGASAFDQDIGAWDTSGVTTMFGMFAGASSFNQDIGAWDTSGVIYMHVMFYDASAFDQDLNWCVANDVNLDYAFEGTPCASTSCGVVQGDACADRVVPANG